MREEELKLLQRFFGTVAGQSELTLQDLADEEDLDLDEEAAVRHAGARNSIKFVGQSLILSRFR